MRLVCISDTHGLHNRVRIPDGDILIHAGDISEVGKIYQIQEFALWLQKQAEKFQHVLIIAGNHDLGFEKDAVLSKETLLGTSKNIHYLEHESIDIDGVTFFGSPYQPEFCNWAFNIPRGRELKDLWSLIPDNTDVLITHGPAFGIGDVVPGKPKTLAGDMDLLKRIEELNLILHVFGHIHNGHGVYNTDIMKNTLFVNASICTEQYNPDYEPIIVKLRKDAICKYASVL